MTKTISIRFINKFGTYYIQRKSLFGWKYLSGFHLVCDQKIYYDYYDGDTENLLNRVIKEHYGVDRKYVIIKEYPMIKYYN
jgi:hypothetical protein